MSLETTSFCLKGPGYAAKYTQLPFGKEVVFEPIPTTRKISSAELWKCFDLVGLTPHMTDEWESSDALVRISAVLDGDAVMSLNVSLDFSGEEDPRRLWSDIWTSIRSLNFTPLEDGLPASVDEQIAHSLAYEMWSHRKPKLPTPDS